ncbi:ABC transporter permease [Chryseolinea soli]|uniref:ABC transporter permease n=1 Tax=Chryseolinea soli TaxID=2321403 RepID=A0A385SYA9_9BACT|nr:ABC transporter permease [Chryseolinea soli]AYB33708.1 ABC transporter permease [Chryseolinea soli]
MNTNNSPKPHPPRWAEKFVKWYCAPHLADEILGDMQEEFDHNVKFFGERRARREYVRNVIGFFKPFAIKRKTETQGWPTGGSQMRSHYFTVAFRNLSRQKTFSIINIAGLSLGLACCMLIALYTKDETSYDKFHQRIDQIYQLTCTRIEKNKKDEKFASAAMVQGPAFKQEISEIEDFVRVKPAQVTIMNGTEILTENVQWVDEKFFTIFSFRLISGNPEKVLSDIHSLVLTETAALKYFGTTDAIGQRLSIQIDGRFEPFQVSGISKDPPQNSTLKFTMLLPFNYLAEIHPDKGWHWVSFPTYFVLGPQADPVAVIAKMRAVYQTQAKMEIDEMKRQGYDNKTLWGLQPFAHMHLNTEYQGTPESSDPIYSYILSGIAVFILLIACINFINLAIAQSLRRSREIGIRKVIGGLRVQLIRQFLSESFALCFIAFVIALAIALLVLPVFNELSNKQLSLTYLLDLNLVTGGIGLYVIIGLATGFYPALVLSGFNPAKALYNRVQYSGKNYLSKSLVVIQFALATFLIIATFFLYAQFDFLTQKDLGYNDKNLVEVTINRAIMDKALTRTLKNEFSRLPGVELIAPRNVGHFGGLTKANENEITATYTHVDEDFIPTLRVALAEGRNFSKAFPGDSIYSVLVNQTFVNEAGWTNAIGKTIDYMSLPDWGDKKMTVVGVVKDFHSESLKERIKPEILTYEPKLPLGKFLVRIAPDHVPETLHAMEGLFLKMFPHDAFQYAFKDDLNRNYYQAENKWKQIITIAACLAIFISCIGLFGLTALNTESRTKEIGIRKVLGASVTQIIGTISGGIIKLVLIGLVIATPLVWYAVDSWLRNFAYRVELTPVTFLSAGLFVTGIALITVSLQAMKAALANPTKSLKSE